MQVQYESSLADYAQRICRGPFGGPGSCFFIRSFVVQAFKIPSGSMLQTLQIGDHLLVTKFAYGIKIPFTHILVWEREGPQHGDIIVFEFPEDPSKDFIKRVIGVPGDVIEVKDKQVFRNGILWTNPTFSTQTATATLCPGGTISGRSWFLKDNTLPWATTGMNPMILVSGVLWIAIRSKARPLSYTGPGKA